MISSFEKQRFSEIAEGCVKYGISGGIGTVSEKTLHFVIKNFISQNTEFHEVKIGRFIADVFDGKKITEIQTANFSYLRKKLDFFREQYPVEIVYPIPVIKNILWINPQTGDISKKRKSPRSGRASDILKELIYIIDYIDKNVKILLYLLETDEYRVQNGWGNGGKRGGGRYDRIPKGIFDIIELSDKEDYYKIIPFKRGIITTRSDIKKALRLNGRHGDAAVKVLRKLGIIEESGREGRKIIYRTV